MGSMEARNRPLDDWFTRIRTRQVVLPRFQRFDPLTLGDAVQPPLGDRRHTVAGSQHGTRHGAVSVGVAARADNLHQRRLKIAPKRPPKGPPKAGI